MPGSSKISYIIYLFFNAAYKLIELVKSIFITFVAILIKNDKYNVDRDATNIHLLYRLKGNNSNDIY
jgi:hypothetical protein